MISSVPTQSNVCSVKLYFYLILTFDFFHLNITVNVFSHQVGRERDHNIGGFFLFAFQPWMLHSCVFQMFGGIGILNICYANNCGFV